MWIDTIDNHGTEISESAEKGKFADVCRKMI